MAIQKIQYTNKEQLVNDTTINDKYKCKADDLNEIKSVVNNNADEIPSNDNLVNVGTSVDTDYRTNILYSKNLFDIKNTPIVQDTLSDAGITLTFNDDGTITANGTNTGTYKFIKYNITLPAGTYYYCGCVSGGTTNGYSMQTSNPSTADYGNGGTFKLTQTTTVGIIPIRIGSETITFNNAVFKPMVAKVPVTYNDYEPYTTPSINIDGNEIYSRPVVLWTNSNPTSDFAGQEITLSENLSNYSYYEILYLFSKNDNYEFTTGKIETNRLAFLGTLSSRSGNLVGYRRLPSAINNNKITFGGGSVISSSGTTENNSICIPYKVIGYK